jgi:DnaJ-class molecular chaperone
VKSVDHTPKPHRPTHDAAGYFKERTLATETDGGIPGAVTMQQNRVPLVAKSRDMCCALCKGRGYNDNDTICRVCEGKGGLLRGPKRPTNLLPVIEVHDTAVGAR